MGFLNDMYKARGQALPDRVSPYVFGDKGSYVSPMDRSTVEGRTAHREHMKKHGVVEAGDMKLGETSGIDRAPMGGVRQDINRAMQELNSR